jgi:hypothetical protein
VYFDSNNTAKSKNDPAFDKFKLRDKYHIQKIKSRCEEMNSDLSREELGLA